MLEGVVPKNYFVTNGVGINRDKLAAFEAALRDAGIQMCNLVTVSSILPPNCKRLSRKEGQALLKPGQVVFCVMARQETDEPNRLVAAAVGIALPNNGSEQYGYISEHHTYGQTAKKAGDYAEDLAATMLATTLGIKFNPDKAWNQRKQIYQMSGHIFKTSHICQSAEGHKDGLWTSAVSAVVFC